MTPPDKSSADGIPARLARLNPTTVFLATIAYALVALFAPGVFGGALLLALAGALLGLLAMTWPVQPTRVRVGRLLILGAVVTAGVIKILF